MKNKTKEKSRKIQKEIKNAKKTYKTVKTTLEWLDIAEIKDNAMYLKNGEVVIGVKLKPRNIFIDPAEVQRRVVNNLRITLNKLKFPIYWGYVFSPVDLTEHSSQLLIQLEQEEDYVIKSMIQNDLDKATWFSENYRELGFFLMIKDIDKAKLIKKYEMLVGELQSSGFNLRELGDNDYYDYVAYLFENETISNFYFSRGIFKCLQDEEYTSRKPVIYTADFDIEDIDEE